METLEFKILQQGYVKKGKDLGKCMKRKYVYLCCTSKDQTIPASLRFAEDEQQLKKKNSSIKMLELTCITSIQKVAHPKSKENSHLIEIQTKDENFKTFYMEFSALDIREDWLCDIEFLVRLPYLKIPIKHLGPGRYSLVLNEELLSKVKDSYSFIDACPVKVNQTELGLNSHFSNEYYFLLLKKETLHFIHPNTMEQYLVYQISNLRRCGNWKHLVFIEAGRRTETGEGYLWLYVDSQSTSKDLFNNLSAVMGGSAKNKFQKYLCWNSCCTQSTKTDSAKYKDWSMNHISPPTHISLSNRNSSPSKYNTSHQRSSSAKLSSPSNYFCTGRTSESEFKTDSVFASIADNTCSQDSPLIQLNTTPSATYAFSAPTNHNLSIRESISDNSIATVLGSRYDMVNSKDVEDLVMLQNGTVSTKEKNIVGADNKNAFHSYYDIDGILHNLKKGDTLSNVKPKKPLKPGQVRSNTVQTKKMSEDSYKEKISNSVFYKGPLLDQPPQDLSYATFTELEMTQSKIETLKKFSHDQPICKSNGNLMSAYDRASNEIADEDDNIYKVPDAANRPVNFDLRNDPTYQTPTNISVSTNSPNPDTSIYQVPKSNREVLLAQSDTNELKLHPKKSIKYYDHLANQICLLPASSTCEDQSADIYERMDSFSTIIPPKLSRAAIPDNDPYLSNLNRPKSLPYDENSSKMSDSHLLQISDVSPAVKEFISEERSNSIASEVVVTNQQIYEIMRNPCPLKKTVNCDKKYSQNVSNLYTNTTCTNSGNDPPIGDADDNKTKLRFSPNNEPVQYVALELATSDSSTAIHSRDSISSQYDEIDHKTSLLLSETVHKHRNPQISNVS